MLIRVRGALPVVAPAWVLTSESKYEVLRLRRDWRPAGIRPVLRAVELRANESAVPAQDRVRFGDTAYFGEGFAAHSLADLSQGAALRIRQTEARWQVCA